MANRTIKVIGDTAEAKLAALNAARNKGATVWGDGTQGVPIGTHLFVAAEGDIFGLKKVESKTQGILYLPIIAGKMILFGSNKEVIFNLDEEINTHKLFFPERFKELIEPGEKVYLTIGKNSNGWTEVTNISSADF